MTQMYYCIDQQKLFNLYPSATENGQTENPLVLAQPNSCNDWFLDSHDVLVLQFTLPSLLGTVTSFCTHRAVHVIAASIEVSTDSDTKTDSLDSDTKTCPTLQGCQVNCSRGM